MASFALVVVVVLVVVVLLAMAAVTTRNKNRLPADSRLAPLVPTRFYGIDLIIESALAAWNNHELESIDEIFARVDSADRSTLRVSILGNDHACMFSSDPEVLLHMTAKNFPNWNKGRSMIDCFQELLGEGIFNTNGEKWKLHREIARPHFARGELMGYVQSFNDHFSHVEEIFERACQSGETVNVADVFQRFTMDSFAHIFFGHELNSLRQPSEFASHFDNAQSVVSWRMRLDPFWKLLPRMLPSFRKSINYIDTFVLRLIDEARHDKNLAERTDLLAHYLRTADLDGKPFTDKYLRDMLVNFLLAGRDTTAALLTWTVYLLAQHPEVEKKMVEEIEDVVGMDRFPTSEDIPKLRYTKLVLNEVLRLYPSVPVNIRTSQEDDVLPNGMFVPAGTDLFMCTYFMHRDKRLWGPTADKFDPERHENSIKLGQKYPTHPFAFLPFHAGPRVCPGQNMALTEARVAVVRMFQKYRLRHDVTNDIQLKCDIILMPANGMRVFVDRR